MELKLNIEEIVELTTIIDLHAHQYGIKSDKLRDKMFLICESLSRDIPVQLNFGK